VGQRTIPPGLLPAKGLQLGAEPEPLDHSHGTRGAERPDQLVLQIDSADEEPVRGKVRLVTSRQSDSAQCPDDHTRLVGVTKAGHLSLRRVLEEAAERFAGIGHTAEIHKLDACEVHAGTLGQRFDRPHITCTFQQHSEGID